VNVTWTGGYCDKTDEVVDWVSNCLWTNGYSIFQDDYVGFSYCADASESEGCTYTNTVTVQGTTSLPVSCSVQDEAVWEDNNIGCPDAGSGTFCDAGIGTGGTMSWSAVV